MGTATEALEDRRRALAMHYADLHTAYDEVQYECFGALEDMDVDEDAFQVFIERLGSLLRQLKATRLEMGRLKHSAP